MTSLESLELVIGRVKDRIRSPIGCCDGTTPTELTPLELLTVIEQELRKYNIEKERA